MGSTSTAQEERPDEPTPKRHKIMEEERSQVERFSPTQSPLRIGEEQLTGEQVEQIGSQGGVFITQAEIDEGTLQEPPPPSFDLTISDYRGKELDPVLEQASHQFLSDDSFVKSRVFHQFAWRVNMNNFEERCTKLKAEHPEMDEKSIQSHIKEEMSKEFQKISPEEGRQMVKASNILLLPNWDIANALVFNSVSNRLDL